MVSKSVGVLDNFIRVLRLNTSLIANVIGGLELYEIYYSFYLIAA